MKVVLLEIPSQKEYLINRNPFLIGRKQDNHLPVASPVVSKYHCRIIEKNNHYFLEDLQSKNHTYLNSSEVHKSTEIRNSDIISLGHQGPAFQFRLKADSPEDLDHTLIRNSETVILLKKQLNGTLNEKKKQFLTPQMLLLLITIPVLTGITLFLFSRMKPSSGKVNRNLTVMNYNLEQEPQFSYRDLLLRNINLDTQAKDVKTRLILLMERYLEDSDNLDEDIIKKITAYIRYFRKSSDYRAGLKRRALYLPMIEKTFQEANIPADLSYIAFVESFYLPDAYNRRSGATGMWQFLPATAREYGLKVRGRIDERKDPVKSTLAASRYIQDLLAIFGVQSIPLAIASYNAGDQSIRAMLKKITNPRTERNFWYLYKNKMLPQETREYVLKILALILLTETPDIITD